MNSGDRFSGRWPGEADLGVRAGMWLLPLTGLAACPVVVRGSVGGGCGWHVAVGCGDRVWAGQAALAGGPVAAPDRFIHSCSRCQPWGRCKVISLPPLVVADACRLHQDLRLLYAGISPNRPAQNGRTPGKQNLRGRERNGQELWTACPD